MTEINKGANAHLKKKGAGREQDTSLGWLDREHPHLTAWRILAVEWLKGETRGLPSRLRALSAFFDRFIARQGLPHEPSVFLARSTSVPNFYLTACPNSFDGIKNNNHINSFLQYVLLKEFSEETDNGQLVVSPAFHNPVPRMSREGLPRRDESVHSPLPYGYIDELRQILAAGPHFRDWQWAQQALGAKAGTRGRTAPDWFEVTEAQIDRTDPDCVWRIRKLKSGYRGGQVLEMWSPVRWVALLVKLILPLRTHQVRFLDSGEADTWRFEAGSWTLNPSPLAGGSERRPVQLGVFRRSQQLGESESSGAVLYINTNKTADMAKAGEDKGYLMPWCAGGPIHQDVFYWLEKMRNWQEKYNPVSRRTAWGELDARHVQAKSEIQLSSYPDACFLFRLPEECDGSSNLPLQRAGQLEGCWFRLLSALQIRIAERGETHSNGAPIQFLPPVEEQNCGLTTLFPLHSLRVSLITALALEGQVPFPVLQKLVGHSRLLMTLYYTKPGPTHVRKLLHSAAERLEAGKEVSIQNFLLDTAHEELLQKAVCNSVPSLAVAIPQHPSVRNPVGWMPMHHGLCLVGGNTSENEGNSAIGGCYNGGAYLGSATSQKYGPVSGGSRNCVRCRWFVTEPHHLPALAAHFNTLAYHFDEARNTCLTREEELQNIKRQKADAEDSGHPFVALNAHRQAERVWESAMKRFSDLAEDLVACWRLIERCKLALGDSQEGGTQLIAAGEMVDVQAVFEETESELLQLTGICDSVEMYPDLDPGKAVFRRSQLLDAVLYNDGRPPLFMTLSEQEQLLAGNAFMRHLSQQMDPTNPILGQREVIRLMDAGVRLSQHFDVDLSHLLSVSQHPAQGIPVDRVLLEEVKA
ncbi:TPA: VPA1269 family protein [Stenotrophomonas maltophilia]|nr:hypothetical protein [Stenotrophomonas maltophilia]MBH1795746.1 hypothetical protein [Stenotrophomonas maltophilia]HDS1322406.1 hypothetical protein [Stenotrophomonas maltophilia]HDS1326702.1 hypothetical protein [Stenotrophomonas maltophilia]HDS1331198.1 hypothetical protein [Stenotrophomonas maltophilia]